MPETKKHPRSTPDAAGMRRRTPSVARVFGDDVNRLQRDECGDQAEARSDRKQWEQWLTEQKPPHYDH